MIDRLLGEKWHHFYEIIVCISNSAKLLIQGWLESTSIHRLSRIFRNKAQSVRQIKIIANGLVNENRALAAKMARHLESAVGIYNTSIDNLYLDETIELSYNYRMPSK